jgi:hypothetical protein
MDMHFIITIANVLNEMIKIFDLRGLLMMIERSTVSIFRLSIAYRFYDS